MRPGPLSCEPAHAEELDEDAVLLHRWRWNQISRHIERTARASPWFITAQLEVSLRKLLEGLLQGAGTRSTLREQNRSSLVGPLMVSTAFWGAPQQLVDH